MIDFRELGAALRKHAGFNVRGLTRGLTNEFNNYLGTRGAGKINTIPFSHPDAVGPHVVKLAPSVRPTTGVELRMTPSLLNTPGVAPTLAARGVGDPLAIAGHELTHAAQYRRRLTPSTIPESTNPRSLAYAEAALGPRARLADMEPRQRAWELADSTQGRTQTALSGLTANTNEGVADMGGAGFAKWLRETNPALAAQYESRLRQAGVRLDMRRTNRHWREILDAEAHPTVPYVDRLRRRLAARKKYEDEAPMRAAAAEKAAAEAKWIADFKARIRASRIAKGLDPDG